MAIELNGNICAKEIYERIGKIHGKFAIITIGEDDASKVYVRKKIEKCAEIGVEGFNYRFQVSDNSDENKKTKDEIIQLITSLNSDTDVIGIMIQRPYDTFFVGLEDYINPIKDVDGLGSYNMGMTMRNLNPYHYPATPLGIITLLDFYKVNIESANVVIIGRSEIVGRPLASMLSKRNATVTLCHSKTDDDSLNKYIQNADIIVSAVGKAHFITSENFINGYVSTPKDGSKYLYSYKMPIIIDVGINRNKEGKLCGDCDFDDLLPYSSGITPVPKGVGPMTVVMLMHNLYNAYMHLNGKIN